MALACGWGCAGPLRPAQGSPEGTVTLPGLRLAVLRLGTGTVAGAAASLRLVVSTWPAAFKFRGHPGRRIGKRRKRQTNAELRRWATDVESGRLA